MNLNRLVILFLCLLLPQGMFLWQQEQSMYTVFYEKERLDQALTGAVMDCASFLKEKADGNGTPDTVDLKWLESVFFTSLYQALGVQSDVLMQEKLRAYIPLFAYVAKDGIQVRYYEITNKAGEAEYIAMWSDKIPFDGETEQKTVGAAEPEKIIQKVSQVIEKYLNQYNTAAARYGISYQTYIPTFEKDDSARMLLPPSVLAVFQGYPLRQGGKIYSRYAVGGARIRKKSRYIVTEEREVFYYHREENVNSGFCTGLQNNNIDRSGRTVTYELNADNAKNSCWIMRSKEECAQFGAYPCPKCFLQL